MKCSSVKNEVPVWSDAGVWICTKCFKGTDTAENLKSEFKSQLKEMGCGKRIRVMTSSCLGICPKEAQAMVVAPTLGKQLAFVFDPKKDKEEIFEKLKKLLD